MTKPLTITDVLKGNVRPVRQLRWQFDCPCCGRDNGMSGMPSPVRCVDCLTEINPTENPMFVSAD